MNIRFLEIFCAVAECHNFSLAAKNLDVSQSAVSQAMQSLEEDLGVTLIDRSNRPLTLTTAGAHFHRGAAGIVRSVQRLRDDIRHMDDIRNGRLCIASIVSVGLSYLPAASKEFADLYPEIEVATAYGTSERVAEMVVGGEADFGLVSFAKPGKDFTAVPWLDEPMRIICSEKHPFASRREVNVAELADVPMCGFTRSLMLRQQIDRAFNEQGLRPDVRMEFDNADSMIRGIQATGGIGVLPEAAVRQETADGKLKVVACRGWRMNRPLAMIFRRGQELSRPAEAFGSLLLGRSIQSEIDGKPNKRPDSDDRVSVVA